ncbi:hypothetical protein AC249_AIPGENE13054, partial [Exaiptasia diaphana]
SGFLRPVEADVNLTVCSKDTGKAADKGGSTSFPISM